MQSKKPEQDWLTDEYPKSKWGDNSAVGMVSKQLTKKVAKYHATRGKKKL